MSRKIIFSFATIVLYQSTFLFAPLEKPEKELKKEWFKVINDVVKQKEAVDTLSIKTLILQGADINWQQDDDYGKTALHKAIESDNKEVIDFLLKQKPDILIQDKQKVTPFHMAATLGNTELVKEMLDNFNIDPDTKGVDNNTALLLATKSGKLETVKLLLQYDVNPFAKSTLGISPISFITNQIEKYKKNEMDTTALENIHRALENKVTAIKQSLLQQMNSTPPDLKKIEKLISHLDDLNFADESGNTPLHFAAKNNLTEMVKTIINKQALVNMKNYKLETPLYDAVSNENKEIVDLIIKSDAEIEPGDRVILQGRIGTKIAQEKKIIAQKKKKKEKADTVRLKKLEQIKSLLSAQTR